MTLFLTILAYTVLVPASLVGGFMILARVFLAAEYRFIPFRWREGNPGWLALPMLWFFPWLAFWIWWFVEISRHGFTWY